MIGIKKPKKKNQIGHHARPRQASATAPLRTGADMCKSGSGAGKCSGAKSNTVRRRSNHARTEGQADRQKRANTDAAGGWQVHTADDTPRRNAATRSKHLSFMCHGNIRPRAAAGSSRNGTTQAVAATTGIRPVGNAASNTASACSDPEHTRKRSSRRRASATELSRPGIRLQAKRGNHREAPLRQVHATHRASSGAKRGGHVQLCSKPRGHAESNPRPLEEGVSFHHVLRPLD